MSKDKSKLLSYCNCCTGITKLTPTNLENPPGLSSIKYRVGTYGQFKQSMHTKLGQVLSSLETRENDDLAIGIVDACATILDILTFYQERIANEGFLNTAKERRSVLELARSIGYELSPGVSADVFLSFTLENAQKDVEKIIIHKGNAVQTLPGQDELPQIFETDDTVETRPEWNELKPQLTTLPDLNREKEKGTIYLKGTNLNLNPGDGLLLIRKVTENDNDVIKKEPMKISSVIEDPKVQQTQVEIVEYTLVPKERAESESSLQIFDTIIKVMSQNLNQSEFMSKMLTNNFITTDIVKSINYFVKNPVKKIPLFSITYPINKVAIKELSEDEIGVYAFRVRTSVFGHNAPSWEDIPKGKALVNGVEGDFMTYPDSVDQKSVKYTSLTKCNENTIHLENIHSKILENTWIILNSGEEGAKPYKVTNVAEKSVSGFSLTSQVTALTVEDEDESLSKYMIRNTTIYAQSEKLELAELPFENDPSTNSILLDKMVNNLKEGQFVAITGEPKNFPGTTKSSIHSISKIQHDGGYTELDFKEQLPEYVRSSITINANVVPASHGESKYEKLGSGDKTKKNLEFVLKQNPLTHIHTTTGDGITNTLEIRVNNILWKNVSSLNYLTSDDEAYIIRIDDDGKSHVIFGDGVNGKVPPTGLENITAKYRVGSGMDGIVQDNKISLLKNRPFGVKSVSNPTPSTGAEDQEKLEDARKNATKRILTMDRIVSLKDVEHYASAFPGIGKAKSIWFWNAEKQMVHLTVASASGQPIEMNSKLYSSLKESINTYKDPLISIKIDTFRPKFFDVVTGITIDERMEFDKVSESVKESLVDKFSFAKRDFGQHVTISEVISTIQDVNGVKAVDIDNVSYLEGDNRKTVELDNKGGIIPSSNADMTGGSFKQAELLMINPYGITIYII